MYLAGGCQFCTSLDHQRRDCKAAKTMSQPFQGRVSGPKQLMFRHKHGVDFDASRIISLACNPTCYNIGSWWQGSDAGALGSVTDSGGVSITLSCCYCCRRHSSQHPSLRGSQDPPFREERRSRGDRSPRNHRASGGRRHRSRSRSTDTGSRKRRKESGFSGDAAPAPPHVAGDPTSAAAAGWCLTCHVIAQCVGVQRHLCSAGMVLLSILPLLADFAVYLQSLDLSRFIC